MTTDPLNRAKQLLDRLEADEPAMRKRIDEAFADMADAREELALHIAAMRSEIKL